VPIPSPRPFRKRINWLIAIAVEAAAPALRAYAASRAGLPSHPSQWRKALIIGDNHIGDLLYRSASLQHLKQGLPACEFHYLTAPGPAQIIDGNPAISSILPWHTADSPLAIAPDHFAALRAMRFDAALCTNCIKYWPELLLALRLGIPNRVAYTYKGFSAWVTHPIPIAFPSPYPAYFRDYVAALTTQPPAWSLRPIIFPTSADESAAAALFARLDLARHSRLVACFMTTRQPTAVWPPENFGRALRNLRDTAGIVLCGAASDLPLLTRINNDFDLQAAIVAGDLTLRALCAFLRRFSAILTTDSGPRHIANAAGIPVFFFRNLRSDPVETGAYLDTETDFCPPATWLDPTQHHAILASITPDTVAAALATTIHIPMS